MNENKEWGLKWFAKADEDLAAAETPFRNSPETVHNIIGFHCQQAIEKYFKGFLTYHHVDFLFTHDLETLLHQCSLIDNDFSHFDLENLTDYAVVYRYPDSDNELTLEETQEYISLAVHVKHFVKSKINLQ